jgi:hypothetical protein
MGSGGMRRFVVVGVGALGLVACQEHQRPFFGLEDKEAKRIEAPLTERCQRYASGSTEAAGCTKLSEAGLEWTRRLNVGDEFCMEALFGDEVHSGCKSRGVVVDTGSANFVIEIRDAHADSAWLNYNERKIWYATGAMVDEYVKERGYE